MENESYILNISNIAGKSNVNFQIPNKIFSSVNFFFFSEIALISENILI